MRRVALVFLGYLAACAVAGLAFPILWTMNKHGNFNAVGSYHFFDGILLFGIFAAILGVVVIPAVAYAEYVQERRYAFYAVSGLLAGLLPLLAGPVGSLFSRDGVTLLAMLGGSGLLAATAYWLIAGRTAGRRAAPTTMTD